MTSKCNMWAGSCIEKKKIAIKDIMGIIEKLDIWAKDWIKILHQC